ncbi:MAG: ABC transporter transmembrane domain-containing protein, partial [Sulfobacillus sp.]|nr:ABC transporter transmembrane domain-containing protein [Sulfobacillus sp.]
MVEVLSSSTASSQPVLRRLLRYLRPFRRTLAIALGLLLLATLTDVAQPFVIKTFINRDLIPRHFAFTALWLLGVGYLGLIIASAGLNVGQLFLFQKVALAIVKQLREDVFQHVLDLSMPVLDRTPVGVLVSRITNDTEAI